MVQPSLQVRVIAPPLTPLPEQFLPPVVVRVVSLTVPKSVLSV